VIDYYNGARTNTKVFKQLFCKDLLFVYYDCPLGCVREERWSQYNYILYIVTGKKLLSTRTRSWLITKGTAVFVKKGACLIEKVDGEVLSLMAFFVPDNYLCSFLTENLALMTKVANNSHENDLVLSLEVNDMMYAYYESVKPYFFSQIKPPEYLLELKFKELLVNIIRNPANTELNNYLNTLVSTKPNNIQPIIEANYCYNLTIGEYARLCNRSLSSFKRDFYSIYGESPARWILIKRLSHALDMLCNSNNTILDISFKSGFENSTHFSHAFKKHFGISPLSYRQKYSRVER
jgi:AraC family transcriptional regulator, exoenzyme S synthesis regulatory protein ExsA